MRERKVKLRFDSIERRKNAFLLYEKALAKERGIVAARGSYSAIAVSDDSLVKDWQQIRMRLEILKTYLSGGDDINWFHAHWLTADEAKKRMGIK